LAAEVAHAAHESFSYNESIPVLNQKNNLNNKTSVGLHGVRAVVSYHVFYHETPTCRAKSFNGIKLSFFHPCHFLMIYMTN
jgi:hypothetical protein